MVAATLRRVWKNAYVQTAIMIVLVLLVVFGLWFGSQLALGTQYPMLAVASGSMCEVQPNRCDGWSHPFGHTLHTGDLIIVKGVSPEEIHAAEKPEGDIIIFRRSPGDELIVHRAIEKKVQGGNISFVTQGDGNPTKDPPIPASNVVGKVILRIPWIGHLALFMRNSSSIYLIAALIIIVVIVEFALPAFRREDKKTETEENSAVKYQDKGTIAHSGTFSRVSSIFTANSMIASGAFKEPPHLLRLFTCKNWCDPSLMKPYTP